MTRGRRNNFDLIRLGAALCVVISHAWPLSLGPGTVEPLENWAPFSLGGAAVLIFFFVSGLLVTQSMHRSDRGIAGFAMARVGRIFPGLAVALGLTALAFFAFTGPGYDLPAASQYVARGLSLASLQHEVPGLFASNPYPFAANGPLWTLFYEVACYGALAVAACSGVLRNRLGWLAIAVLVSLNWLWFQFGESSVGLWGYRLSTGAPLALAFLAGALAWRMRHYLPLDWRLGGVLGVLAVIAGPTTLALPVHITALGYVSLLIAYRSRPIRLGGDISYGVYIYGWPVAQALVAILGPVNPATLAILGVLTVIPIALASWVWIERPAIALVATIRWVHGAPVAQTAGEVR